MRFELAGLELLVRGLDKIRPIKSIKYHGVEPSNTSGRSEITFEVEFCKPKENEQ